MGRYSNDAWPPYVSAAKRRRKAADKVKKLKKSGKNISPIEITGRKITTTFWGTSWCKNLEAYSDYSNRLPRGRTYVRHGSVIDLKIENGHIHALVSGTELYEVEIKIKPLSPKRWMEIKGRCAGQIASLVELLRGSLSKEVMEIVTRKDEGLFPKPREISFDCSCPDWATMCKHVAATLYGVGARLDHQPELLFTLRNLDPAEMVEAAIDQPKTAGKSSKGRVLKTDELSSVFGIDIDTAELPSKKKPVSAKTSKARKGAAKTGKPADPKGARKRAVPKAVSKIPEASKKAAAEKEVSPKKTSPKKRIPRRKSPKKPSAEKAGNEKTS